MRRAALIVAAALLSTGCASPECDVAPVTEGRTPDRLSQTGLFCETPDELQSDVSTYEPAFFLWSDGLTKRRFLRLPDEGDIDTSDMNRWSFPVGTRLWKEIADEDGPVETRLAERWGPGDDDWNYATYLWRTTGDEADVTVHGFEDITGTGYDVPDEDDCQACHGSSRERVLGLSAVQLATDGGRETVRDLADRFTEPPAVEQSPLEGDELARDALGFLHANCGACHHDGPRAINVSMDLRLRPSDRTEEDTAAYRTTVGVDTEIYQRLPTRVIPGDAGHSAVLYRLGSRGNYDQMPPIGTNRIDHSGTVDVVKWINRLAEGELP